MRVGFKSETVWGLAVPIPAPGPYWWTVMLLQLGDFVADPNPMPRFRLWRWRR